MEKRRCIILIVVAVLILIIIIVGVVLGLTLRPKELKPVFLKRCEDAKGSNCEQLWDLFQQAYVNRDPCQVPMERYDPLIYAAPFKPSCNKVMLWSQTKDVVHDFTEKRDCFVTLEDTLLGSVLDGLTWCGKQGSSETWTTGCLKKGDTNPVRSFWKRISAGFAEVACGDVTAMLSGSICEPFDTTSIFASIEVKRLKYPRVRSLTVVLVMKKNAVTNCTNGSLKNLQMVLDKGIQYNCKEVSESQLKDCSSHPEKPCGSCW